MKKISISIILFSAALSLSSGCEIGANSEEGNDKSKIEEIKTNEMKELKVDEETKNLIDGLNEAVKAGGDPDHPVEGLISKGEATAMFAEFKKRLNEGGYQIKWTGDEYQLIKN
jgi:hypothetical protein